VSEELRHHRFGTILGIAVGTARFVQQRLQSLVDLMVLILEMEERRTPRRWVREVLSMDREAWTALGLAIVESSRDPRALAESVWEPVLNIFRHLRRGVDIAAEDQVESSAEIWQATLETLDLLDTYADAASGLEHAPALVRRLSDARRRLADVVARRGAEVGSELRRLYQDEGGTLDLSFRLGEDYRLSARDAFLQRRRETLGFRALRRDPRVEARDFALDLFTSTPGNPLLVLVDETGNFDRPLSRTREYQISGPYMELGHTVTRASGEPERLALEWMYLNQLTPSAERRGVVFCRGAVEIGGFPVELETARMLEFQGLLAPGTVDAAPISLGWSLDDYEPQPIPGSPEIYRWILRSGSGQ